MTGQTAEQKVKKRNIRSSDTVGVRGKCYEKQVFYLQLVGTLAYLTLSLRVDFQCRVMFTCVRA